MRQAGFNAPTASAVRKLVLIKTKQPLRTCFFRNLNAVCASCVQETVKQAVQGAAECLQLHVRLHEGGGGDHRLVRAEGCGPSPRRGRNARGSPLFFTSAVCGYQACLLGASLCGLGLRVFTSSCVRVDTYYVFLDSMNIRIAARASGWTRNIILSQLQTSICLTTL